VISHVKFVMKLQQIVSNVNLIFGFLTIHVELHVLFLNIFKIMQLGDAYPAQLFVSA
jgi:hypothetical protein